METGWGHATIPGVVQLSALTAGLPRASNDSVDMHALARGKTGSSYFGYECTLAGLHQSPQFHVGILVARCWLRPGE